MAVAVVVALAGSAVAEVDYMVVLIADGCLAASRQLSGLSQWHARWAASTRH